MGNNKSRPPPKPQWPSNYIQALAIGKNLRTAQQQKQILFPIYNPNDQNIYSTEVLKDFVERNEKEKKTKYEKDKKKSKKPATVNTGSNSSASDCKKITPPSQANQERIALPVPNPIPPLPDLPNIGSYGDGIDILFNKYGYWFSNQGYIDDMLRRGGRMAADAKHVCTSEDPKVAWDLGRVIGDEKTIGELKFFSEQLSSINNNFQQVHVNSDVAKDVETSAKMLEALNYYCDNTLPAFHTNKVVIPLNTEIDEVKKNTALYEKVIEAIDQELNNLGNVDSLNSNLISSLSDTKDLGRSTNSTLRTDDISNKKRLYDGVKLENKIFDKKVQNDKNKAVLQDRESIRVMSSSITVSNVYNFMFYGYFIILLGVLYLFFIANDYNVNFNFKVSLVIALIVYPFIIIYIEKYFYYISKMLYSLITNKPFKDPKLDYNTTNKK
jgi:hypothetical protein